MSDSAKAAAEPEDEKKPSAVEETVEIIKTVVYALAIALFLRVLFFQPFTIPSESMEPALLKGDYIIVSKWSYGYSRHSIPFSPPIFSGRIFGRDPERGDIVVFKLPRDPGVDFIKRLIGLPGDRIQVRDGVVFVNDVAIPRVDAGPIPDPGEPSLTVEQFRETMASGRTYVTFDRGPNGQADNTQVYTVPQGCYFMMGDNRDNSLDSRFDPDLQGKPDLGCAFPQAASDGIVFMQAGVGFVPRENLVGKAQIIMLSWDKDASIFKPWTWFMNARPSRFFHGLY